MEAAAAAEAEAATVPSQPQQQQQQQQAAYDAYLQQQQQMMYAQQMAAAQQAQQASAGQPAPGQSSSANATASDLSALQLQQLQQLQFQQLQWHYLQQLQQQQAAIMHAMQAQQAAGQGAGQGQGASQAALQGSAFDPTSGGAPVRAASGASQYRSAYQTYDPYPTSSGAAAPTILPPIAPSRGASKSGSGSASRSRSNSGSPTRARRAAHAHEHEGAEGAQEPRWDDSLAFPSKSNPDRYIAHRSYFSHIPPVVNRLPRKPELKELVLKGREFYANNRDPRFYDPIAESGWDNRAQVVLTPITSDKPGLGRSGSAGSNLPVGGMSSRGMNESMHSLPSVSQAREEFGPFPVLVDNAAAGTRAGSKLLVPFLSHWPPPFRFDYLKKHSRAPLSPFLASVNGYDVPEELYMSARQRAAKARAEEEARREQGGFDYYGPEESKEEDFSRPDPHSSDPIERARARAHTHTTYWKSVNPASTPAGASTGAAAGAGAGAEGQDAHSHTHGQQRGRGRKEWNSRHHLVPPPPRVGQTTAKKPASRRERAQQHLLQMQQQAQQQAAMVQQAQMGLLPQGWMAGQPLPPLILPNGQPFMPYLLYPPPAPGTQAGVVDPNAYPFAAFQPGMTMDPAQMQAMMAAQAATSAEEQQQQQEEQQGAQQEATDAHSQSDVAAPSEPQADANAAAEDPSSSSSASPSVPPTDPSSSAATAHTDSSSSRPDPSSSDSPDAPSDAMARMAVADNGDNGAAEGEDSSSSAQASASRRGSLRGADSTEAAPSLLPGAGSHIKELHGQLYPQTAADEPSEPAQAAAAEEAPAAEQSQEAAADAPADA